MRETPFISLFLLIIKAQGILLYSYSNYKGNPKNSLTKQKSDVDIKNETNNSNRYNFYLMYENRVGLETEMPLILLILCLIFMSNFTFT